MLQSLGSFRKPVAAAIFSFFAIGFIIKIHSHEVNPEGLISTVLTKRACVGLHVPVSWSVLKNDASFERSTASDIGAHPHDEAFCSIAPAHISIGDVPFLQIDFALISEDGAEHELRSATDSGLVPIQEEGWSRQVWRIDYPLDPDGPTKAEPGGTKWLVLLPEGEWLKVVKWSRGNVIYEWQVAHMLSHLNVSELIN